jgi:hypothetical protein
VAREAGATVIAVRFVGLILMVAGTLGIWFLLGWCFVQLAVGP